MDTPRTPIYFRHLRRQIETHLALSELKVLGFDLGIQIAELPGSSKLEKIHHFLLALAHHGRFHLLLTLLEEHNPYIAWSGSAAIPDAEEQQSDAVHITPRFDDILYQGYLQRLSHHLQNGLSATPPNPALAQRITTQTRRLQPQLNSDQRARLLLYLHENRLITSPQPIISLWQADFSGVDLRGADLAMADLSRANLSHARLAAANLRFTNLSGANLQGSYLSGVDGRRADWRWANLQQTDLRHANLQGTQLGTADLTRARLNAAKLQTANLSHANLQDAIMEHANTTGAIMPTEE